MKAGTAQATAEALADEFAAAYQSAIESNDLDAWSALMERIGPQKEFLAHDGVLDSCVFRLLFAMNHKNRQRNILIDALERRVAALEGDALKFAGTFAAGDSYPRGAVVVRKGSSFVALRETGEDPAAPGCASWALMAQKGRDGR